MSLNSKNDPLEVPHSKDDQRSRSHEAQRIGSHWQDETHDRPLLQSPAKTRAKNTTAAKITRSRISAHRRHAASGL